MRVQLRVRVRVLVGEVGLRVSRDALKEVHAAVVLRSLLTKHTTYSATSVACCTGAFGEGLRAAA